MIQQPPIVTMKPNYKPLKELNDKSKFYQCKVTVLHKGKPQEPKNKPRYQRLVLQDEEGFTMKAIIFGANIEAYAEALQRNGEYKISNATIKRVPDQYASRENEYSMTVNKAAEIIPLTADPSVLGPCYQTIASVPHSTADNVLHDVVGVILYITKLREVPQPDREADKVVEIYIFDESCDRPYMISAWNDLAKISDRILQTWSEKYIIAGFTALKKKSYKGFTLTSTMSTEIIYDPKGQKVDELQTWADANQTVLATARNKQTTILTATLDKPTAIQEIKNKRAHDIWQEERFLIQGKMPKATQESLKIYIGCSKCGKNTNTEENCTTNCSQCLSKNVTCIPRAILKTEVVDGTGELELTFYTKEVEKMFESECSELWKIKDNEETIAVTINTLHDKMFRIQIGPTTELSRSRILNWAVRSVMDE